MSTRGCPVSRWARSRNCHNHGSALRTVSFISGCVHTESFGRENTLSGRTIITRRLLVPQNVIITVCENDGIPSIGIMSPNIRHFADSIDDIAHPDVSIIDSQCVPSFSPGSRYAPSVVIQFVKEWTCSWTEVVSKPSGKAFFSPCPSPTLARTCARMAFTARSTMIDSLTDSESAVITLEWSQYGQVHSWGRGSSGRLDTFTEGDASRSFESGYGDGGTGVSTLETQ